MSVHQRPWHGLGVVLETRPRNAEEALTLAGLSWEVVQLPVLLDSQAAPPRTIEGYKANVRSDTGDVLGVVTDKYEVVQNRDAFGFLSGLLGSDAAFETAGSLFGGKRVFVTVRLAELEYLIVGGDRTDLFVNFFTSHDGSQAVTVLRTMIRTVCNNTWMGALRDSRYRYSFRHVGDMTSRLHEAREQLHLSIDYAQQFKQFGDHLASQSMAERELARITEELWPNEGTDTTVKSRTRRRNAVMALFVDGQTRGNAPGTKWCAANALLEHIEWQSTVRSDHGRFVRHIEDPQGSRPPRSTWW
jgi:phage/plasmid-like protein (TIGR03299 family)